MGQWLRLEGQPGEEIRGWQGHDPGRGNRPPGSARGVQGETAQHRAVGQKAAEQGTRGAGDAHQLEVTEGIQGPCHRIRGGQAVRDAEIAHDQIHGSAPGEAKVLTDGLPGYGGRGVGDTGEDRPQGVPMVTACHPLGRRGAVKSSAKGWWPAVGLASSVTQSTCSPSPWALAMGRNGSSMFRLGCVC